MGGCHPFHHRVIQGRRGFSFMAFPMLLPSAMLCHEEQNSVFGCNMLNLTPAMMRSLDSELVVKSEYFPLQLSYISSDFTSRSLIENRVDHISRFPDRVFPLAFNHIRGDSQSPTAFISLSLCPIWPIWYTIRKMMDGSDFQSLSYHVVDLESIKRHAALSIEFLRRPLAGRYKPSAYCRTVLRDCANSSQECLVWSDIPQSAIISTQSLESIIRTFPPSTFLSPSTQISFLYDTPLIDWPWDEYVRTPGYAQFRGFLRHCHEHVATPGPTSLRLSNFILRSTFSDLDDALNDDDVRLLALMFVHRFEEISAVDESSARYTLWKLFSVVTLSSQILD